MTSELIRPYRVDVPQAALDDLTARLRRTVWPDELPDAACVYGVANARIRHLVEYWLDSFDWRKVEARLNRYDQYVTTVDGEDIHFLHVRSTRPDAVPLILTHGWPGSIVEYLDVIEPLTDPPDPAAPGFDLVIPSLPGFGFSGPTRSTGWNRYRIARAWAELMRRLGYDRYGAVGNDAGSLISPEIGRLDPTHVIGVHVTQLFSFPSGDPAEFERFTPTDHAALAHLQWFHDTLSSFNTVHSQQPHTLSFALTDSPAGLLGWNAQLFGESLDADFILANVALYWLTGTAGSSLRLYYEDARTTEHPTEPTTTPTGVAIFAGDFQTIRPLAERDHHNIVSWNSYDPELPRGSNRDAGGHYAAHQATDLLVADIAAFFTKLR
jgi:pimeloyl-ACP methyl ester carboxylesterase